MCHSRQIPSQGTPEDPVHRQRHINPYAKPNHDAVRYAEYYQDDVPRTKKMQSTFNYNQYVTDGLCVISGFRREVD